MSDDYTKRAYALSDTHFGQKPPLESQLVGKAKVNRDSLNSSKTIEMVSDEENDIDELYRDGSEESDENQG